MAQLNILVQVILIDICEQEAKPQGADLWLAVLSPGTWPEVLRRFCCEHVMNITPAVVSRELAQAAEKLSCQSLATLHPVDKARLLMLLCDEAVQTDIIRAELDRRWDVYEQVCTVTFEHNHCSAI